MSDTRSDSREEGADFIAGAAWMREEAARLAESESAKTLIGQRPDGRVEGPTAALARRKRSIANMIREIPVASPPPRPSFGEEIEAAAKFTRAAFEAWVDGSHWDGGDVQDALESAGLLSPAIYDPAIHGEIEDIEPGDDCMIASPAMKSIRATENGGK